MYPFSFAQATKCLIVRIFASILVCCSPDLKNILANVWIIVSVMVGSNDFMNCYEIYCP